MEAKTKPIKRNPNLVPLSREHHFGLLFCWKIKQGLALEADPKVIRNYVQYFWDKNLLHHFQEEEELLLTILSDEDSLKKQVLEEHRQIRNLVDELIKDKAIETTKLEKLKDSLKSHIRFEEREFFPNLEQKATAAQLTQIGKLLAKDAIEPEDNFEPEFWVKQKHSCGGR
ncbi:MAG: hemerythrin domain-containing protein [Hymenobacteraceae bacterium]|nr:hemerythrin domain-containing protein [Hymenobacteraceae bacterium]MDX5396446.1 hemerythrin domain-containing protein [Hymenobacteraceae bacterium]MDX5512507.1 hemerythrin domain-containing protein [Hymenobacteraceae bacterium]